MDPNTITKLNTLKKPRSKVNNLAASDAGASVHYLGSSIPKGSIEINHKPITMVLLNSKILASQKAITLLGQKRLRKKTNIESP